MRKLNVLESVSLDGVIQAPGGPEEDTSGGFAYGGWKHDLVDAFWLKIFPVTLGAGKRLFADGTVPAAFKVTESTWSPVFNRKPINIRP